MKHRPLRQYCVQAGLLLFTVLRLQTSMLAQTEPLGAINYSAPPPPSDLGEPGRRSEAGSRGCFVGDSNLVSSESLTALVPMAEANGVEVPWGLSATPSPTFWFFVPEGLAMTTGELVLDDGVQQWVVPASPNGSWGIVHITLPDTVALAPGIPYQWYFNLYCQTQESTSTVQLPYFVQGWIQYVEPDAAFQQQIEQADLRQQVELYATHQFWYDALTAAAQLRQTTDDSTAWADLLQTAGLGEVTQVPLADCCAR